MKEYSKGIYVKFKPEEVEILHDRMKEAGVQNMSAYIRKMGKLYEEDIAEIKKMNNEQTELLKKALEAVIHLYEEDSKKRRCI